MKSGVSSITMPLMVAIVCALLSPSATEHSETMEKKSRRIESNALRTPPATTTTILSSSNENNESIEPSPPDAAASAATTANRRGSASSRKSAAPPSHHHPNASSSMLLQRHMPSLVRPSSRQNVIHGSDSAVVIARMTYLKKEMCKSEPLEQVIKEPGCIRRRIVNRFCYGQCNSFFIPKVVVQSDRHKDRGGRRGNRQGRRRLPKTEEDEEASIASSSFRSCSFCRPKTIEWDVVILQCPNSKPPIRRKRIPVVKQCTCVALSFDRS